MNTDGQSRRFDFTSRSNNFNFLRLLFATLVILSHSFEFIDGNRSHEILTSIFKSISFGEFAVDGFFLLSGYLIVKSWATEPKPLSFLAKRVLRIHPGYTVAVLMCALIVGPLAAEPSEYFRKLSMSAVFEGIVRMKDPAVPEVFKGLHYPWVNGSLWTIPFEFKCYLFVLALGVLGLVRRRQAWLAITLVFFTIAVLKSMGHSIPVSHRTSLWLYPLCRLSMFFFSGGVVYLYREHIRFNKKYLLWSTAAVFIGMFSKDTAEIVLASFGAYVLFYVAFRPTSALEAFRKLPDVSYGVYLYGWPVQALLIWYYPNITPWQLFFLALMGAAALGYASWHIVERPFLKLKPRSQLKASALQPS